MKLSTILLADDDPDDRDFFRDALSAIAAPVKLNTAENGAKAIFMLQQSPAPDLIFLDLNMPVMNGYECLLAIRADERSKTIPVIIFSTSLQPEMVNNVYRSGANLYIVKPNNFTELKKILSRVLSLNLNSGFSKEQFIFQS